MLRHLAFLSILAGLPLSADVLIDSSTGNGGFVSASTGNVGSPDGWTAASGVWMDSGNSSLTSAPFGPDTQPNSHFIQVHKDSGETLTSNVIFTVAPGDTIDLSFDYKIGGSGANPVMQVSIWDSESNTTFATLGTIATATPQAGFTKVDFSHTATTANTNLRLRFTLSAAGGAGKDVHIDRIHLAGGVVTPPEPPMPIEYDTVQHLLSSDSDERILEKTAKLLPRPNQVDWQRLETTYFIHFGPNTFSGREWGTGFESPSIFNPTALDADQWIREIADAGGKMVMLVVKHHDGFCMWPSRYTNHDVASSPWLGGNGDVLRAVADACAERGIELGVYLSPADLYQIESDPGFGSGLYGNGSSPSASVIPTDPAVFSTSPTSGRTPPAGKPVLNFTVDDYNRYFLNQLYELLSEYGSISEVWFDGANPKQTNPPQLYDRQAWYELIRTLQPGAVIAIKGPDARWVGNESGVARVTEWSPLPIANHPDNHDWSDMTGSDLGSRSKLTRGSYLTWYPAETDVPILHGWFWAAGKSVRSTNELIEIYYSSVGRNSNLLLNLSPDNRGLIPDNQLTPLRAMSQVIRQTFSNNLAGSATAAADSEHAIHLAAAAIDGDLDTWWEPESGTSTPTYTLTLDGSRAFDHLVLQEAIASRGQRIENFAVDTWNGSSWTEQTSATTVGHKRILRLASPVTTDKVRIRIVQSRTEPALAEVALFLGADLIEAPVIGSRNAAGEVAISAQAGLAIRYSIGDSEPGPDSKSYTGPIALPLGGTLRAVSVDGNSFSYSVSKHFAGPVPTDWNVVSTDSEQTTDHPAAHAIDDDPATYWHTASTPTTTAHPHQLTIEMDEKRWIRGFSYQPREGGGNGTVKTYRFETSIDGSTWTQHASGDFDNIRNNPVLQTIEFAAAVEARYFRFTALAEINGLDHASAAEISVIPGGFENFRRESGMQTEPLDSDPNNDGIALLQDYYFGFDPAGPSAVAPVSITADNDGIFLDVIRATPVLDLTATVMVSIDLLNWEPSAITPMAPASNGDGRFLDRYPILMGASSAFYRLRLDR